MPPPTGNALIDGVLPLFRLVDEAAEAEPLLMWLVWVAVATVLAALPALAGRARSLLVAVLFVVPGTVVLSAAFVLFSMLLGDLVRMGPLLNVAVALAVNGGVVLAGWRLSSIAPAQMQSADVAVRLARPVLVFAVLLLALALAPVQALLVVPLLAAGAVFFVEFVLTRILLGALRRISTSRSKTDLLRFGCVAPVYVVPDRSLSFVAVAVGLTHGWSAVFVRQQIEDALQSGDAAAIRHATHVLAHEAGHVVQHHGLWRTVAASLAPLVLSHVYRDSGVGSLVFVAAVLTAAGLTFYLAGECAAERFAARFAGPDASSFVAMEAGE